MCCGQKRSELRTSQAQRTARTVPQHNSGNSHVHAVRTQPATQAVTQAAWPHQPANPHTRSVQPQAPPLVSMPQSSITINVRYLETSPIRVRGLVSGMSYEFSGAAPVQQVDARDASSLLNTRFFRRA